MLRAACHCTTVRFEISELADWVLDCNCTLCRRYGAIWSYPQPGQVKIVAGADATDKYLWGDRELEFHRCKSCGCITHMSAVDTQQIYGINVRNIPTLDPKSVSIRRKNNGHTGFFWTRPDAQPEPSHHSQMPPPSGNDWR